MYTIHSRDGLEYVNTAYPVEGLRDGWQKRIAGNHNLLKSPKSRAAYRMALHALLSEFLPPAYQASEPVIRFEAQLRDVLAQIESEG